jgi:hypothetical protein
VSILDGCRIPDVPATSVGRQTLRVLTAVESRADAHFASRRLWRLEASYRCSVTLLGVARCNLLIQCYAPLSGLATPHQVALLARDSAGKLAAAAAAEADLPGIDRVEAVVGWSSARLIEPLRLGVYDALVLGSMPRSRRARRRLLAAAHASGTTVLLGNDR